MNRRPLLASLGAIFATIAVWPVTTARADDASSLLVEVDSDIAKGTKGAAALQAIASDPAPSNLTAAEKSAHVGFTKWVGTAADRISAAVDGLSKARAQYRLKPTPMLLKEMSTLEHNYVLLQQQLQDECTKQPAVSKIMKTKHDTVKNTISNIH